MGAFQDIELEWQGRTYVIKAHRVMGAIYRIEDVITLNEFTEYAQRGAAPVAKLCGAYSAVLKYAGARVSPDDVYVEVFKNADRQEAVMGSVISLMQMMLPPDVRANLNELMEQPEEPGGGPPPGNSRAAASASSKKRTSPRSRKAGG